MKPLIKPLLVSVIFFSCSTPNENITNPKENITNPKEYTIDKMNYGIVIIDSCEYIIYGRKLTHKGNCKYCIERNKKP